MPKVKKIPQRQCVGCREMKDKKALLRVVKAPYLFPKLWRCFYEPCGTV